MESAVVLRRKAEAAVRDGRFSEAAEFYRREAAIYRANGDVNGAKVEEMKAARYSSRIQLFAALPDAPTGRRINLAKYEPFNGCYVGAFIDRDERLGDAFQDENFQSHRDPEEFASITGKKHASTFCYVAYGRKFPSRWVERLHDQDVAPHIAWEPNGGLSAVRDDDYLEGFARAAARTEKPIFLRFASEMNGDWTRYGGNPVEYVLRWRVVADVMRRYAPNVALVWCVNAIPEKPIPLYYPGDAYVDWVGVNFYSVPFRDNSRNRPGLAENPADLIGITYARYSPRKPIMICEYGASRMSSLDSVNRAAWAADKIRTLYAALPRVFPRVKMIDIFDNDNLKYAQPGRQLNNYSVTDTATVLRAYSAAISSDYFLSKVGDSAPTPILPLAASGIGAKPRVVSGNEPLTVSAWARTYSERFAVEYLVNGKLAARASVAGTREVRINMPSRGGKCVLTGVVRDDRGQVAARQDVPLDIR